MLIRVILFMLSTLVIVGCANSEPNLLELKEAFDNDEYTRAFDLGHTLALEGDPDAQYTLGYLFYTGLGTERNIPLGEYWIQIAAEQGQANAIHAMQLIQQSRLLAPTLPDAVEEGNVFYDTNNSL